MKTRMVKLFSVLLCFIILVMSMPLSSFAAVSYPEGVTAKDIESTISKTDTVIYSLLKSTQNKTVKDILLPEVYSSKTLSSLTVGLYSALVEYEQSLASIGVDMSTAAVAEKLSAYPQVQSALKQYSAWTEVKLDNIDWGVNDRTGFTLAVANVMAVFNELLYTVLCSGTMRLGPLLSIKGENGYETAIVPTLKALGCETITDSSVFYEDAKNIKNTMIEHIVDDVLTFFEGVLDAPCERLTDVLPSIAHYFTDGSFDAAVATLTEPLRIQVFNISTFMTAGTLLSFISDSESYTQNFTLNFNDIIGSMGFKIAPIDLQQIADMGTVTDSGVVSNKADVFMYLLTWLLDTVKLNQSELAAMLPASEGEIDINEALTKILAKPTDEIIKLFFQILNAKSGVKNEHLWTFKVVTPASVQFTPNLGAEKYQRMVDGMDDLLNEIIAEGKEYKNVRQLLVKEIYTNKMVSELVVEVYKVLESEELKDLLPMIGLDVSPKALANELTESKYASLRSVLNGSNSFSSVKKENMDWGFKDGSKKGFIEALAASLRPLNDFLNMLLAEDKITILGCIDFYGSDGYNTAVIPVLEALGCSADSIKTYSEYKKYAEKDEGIKVILESVCSLVERVLDKPVYTILEILPNLMYFVDNGSISVCIKNLIYPVTLILQQLDMQDMLDLSQIENIDIQKLITEFANGMDLGITIPEIDLMQFSSMGEIVSVRSKRVYKDSETAISYLQSNKPQVMVTLLRILVSVIKAPGNEDLLNSFMGEMTKDIEGGDMLTTVSKNLIAEIEAMDVDATVEWIYKLLFRERVTKELTTEQEYMPTIIYKNHRVRDGILPFIIFAVIIAAAVMIFMSNKERIIYVLKEQAEMLIDKIEKIRSR